MLAREEHARILTGLTDLSRQNVRRSKSAAKANTTEYTVGVYSRPCLTSSASVVSAEYAATFGYLKDGEERAASCRHGARGASRRTGIAVSSRRPITRRPNLRRSRARSPPIPGQLTIRGALAHCADRRTPHIDSRLTPHRHPHPRHPDHAHPTPLPTYK